MEETIKAIQYIFNIKQYKGNEIEKYYNSNPVGDIMTIGNNSTYNIHNFVKIEPQIEDNTNNKLVLDL